MKLACLFFPQKSPPIIPPKPVVKPLSSRRSSKSVDSPIKEEKTPVSISKDKIGKHKEVNVNIIIT